MGSGVLRSCLAVWQAWFPYTSSWFGWDLFDFLLLLVFPGGFISCVVLDVCGNDGEVSLSAA